MSSAAASSSVAAPAAAAAHWSDKLRAVDRLSGANVKHNNEVVFFTRTWVSIVGGCCCGILGLTNWSGFAFYLLTALLTTLVLMAKISFDPRRVKQSFQGLIYDIVYVY